LPRWDCREGPPGALVSLASAGLAASVTAPTAIVCADPS
jgi:hypothetical protein